MYRELELLVLSISGVVTFLFFLYGYNVYYLLLKARTYRVLNNNGSQAIKASVAVHLPIYNEKYVVRRLLYACARMARHYGKPLVKIVVLDDSDDETSDEIDLVVSELRQLGFSVEVMRRRYREGFKAGALQEALDKSDQEYIAVFDSDSIPTLDFLDRAIQHLQEDRSLAVVQGRWGHLNRGYNFITRAVSIGIDAHFFVEQAGRYAGHCFLNFNGTAGVIRTSALREVGGWSSDTVAEDLDASYRMQLKGYRILYLKDLVVPSEVPPTICSLKRQQARWSLGSLQTAKKLLPSVVRHPKLSSKRKLEAFLHLTYYLVHPLIFVSFLLASTAAIFNLDTIRIEPPPIDLKDSASTVQSLQHAVQASAAIHPVWLAFGAAIVVSWAAVWIYYIATLREQAISTLRNIPNLFVLGLTGYGLSISNTVQAIKALTSRGGSFLRTPKYSIATAMDTWRDKRYQVPLDWVLMLEVGGIVLGLVGMDRARMFENWGIIPILLVYTLSYAFVTLLTLLHSKPEKPHR